jgi:hypothetical protein
MSGDSMGHNTNQNIYRVGWQLPDMEPINQREAVLLVTGVLFGLISGIIGNMFSTAAFRYWDDKSKPKLADFKITFVGVLVVLIVFGGILVVLMR